MSKAYLLAAGVGSRLRPVTSVLPKPLVPFLNQPLVSYQHNNLLSHTEHVRFNISYLAEHLARYIDASPRSSYCLEAEPLGSARTVWEERAYFDQTTIVACADIMASYDVERLLYIHKLSGAMVTIATVEVDDPRRYGVIVSDRDGRIVQFQEKPDQPLSNTISSGIYVFEPGVFEHWESSWKDLGSNTFPALVAKGIAVHAVPLECNWYDVGKIDDYLLLQLQFLGDANMVHPEASVSPGATLDCVIVGSGAVIESGAELSHCVVWAGTHIHTGRTEQMSILTPTFAYQVECATEMERQLRRVMSR